jgi:hypothetical protein
LKLSGGLWWLGREKFIGLHVTFSAVFDINVSTGQWKPRFIVVKGQTVPKGLAVMTHPAIIRGESGRKLIFVDVFMTLHAVALGLVSKDVLMSRVGRFHRKNALCFNMAFDTVLTDLGVGINQFEIGLVVIEFALIAEVLRVMAKVAASVIKFVMKLLFMG